MKKKHVLRDEEHCEAISINLDMKFGDSYVPPNLGVVTKNST